MEVKKYRVKIIEKLVEIVEIEATSEKDALFTAECEYNQEKYVLDYSNYESTKFIIET